MDIAPPLAPFFFAPNEAHPEVRFRLAPLTQPQVAELLSTPGITKSDEAGIEMLYRAGCMAIEAGGRQVEGLTVDGKPALWPQHKAIIPYEMVLACGTRAWNDARTSEEQAKN